MKTPSIGSPGQSALGSATSNMQEMTASPTIPFYRKPLQWIRGLYNWTLSWAETRFGLAALALLAFAEASFFPIPPDVLLMALAFAKPKRAPFYAAVCTLASVAGGVAGWSIGLGLWSTLGIAAECPEFGGGAWLFQIVPGFHCDTFAAVQALYRDNAWLALFSAAFTPIPYKVFTIAAGVFAVPLLTLVLASVVGRGARFFLVAGLIYAFGPSIRATIEKRFELWTILFTVLLLLGFVAVRLVL